MMKPIASAVIKGTNIGIRSTLQQDQRLRHPCLIGARS
jgi:hypothetical protein